MTTSSVQTDYLTNLDLSTISLTGTSGYASSGVSTYTLNTTCIPTITIGTGSSNNWCQPNSWNSGTISSIFMPEEFVNCFPELSRIEKMCEQYPGLKIAFEKFKTTYKLVKDDYDTPEDQRPKP